MADFLGNIMAGMAGPPKASDKEIIEFNKAILTVAKMLKISNNTIQGYHFSFSLQFFLSKILVREFFGSLLKRNHPRN